jgi:hypothetical protein
VLADNVIVYTNIDRYSCFQYPSNKLSEATSARPDGSDADARPPGMFINIPTCASDCVGLQCNCLYQYSFLLVLSSISISESSEPTGNRPDGLDAYSGPPGMLVNISTCASDYVGLECNCLYQYLLLLMLGSISIQ